MIDLDKLIGSAIKSGKIFLGSKKAISAAKSGKAAVLIVASNCPQTIVNNIKRYSKISKVPLYVYHSSGIELGTVCGKPFAVSALFIRETNNQNIILMREKLIMESGS